jgi:hypothetical protein
MKKEEEATPSKTKVLWEIPEYLKGYGAFFHISMYGSNEGLITVSTLSINVGKERISTELFRTKIPVDEVWIVTDTTITSIIDLMPDTSLSVFNTVKVEYEEEKYGKEHKHIVKKIKVYTNPNVQDLYEDKYQEIMKAQIKK